MVSIASVLPPAASRGSGARQVQPASGPARQKPRPGPSDPDVRGAETGSAATGSAAWRDRPEINRESFIEAEFVEVLREAAAAAPQIEPLDETVRQALEAYQRAENPHPILGEVIDIPV